MNPTLYYVHDPMCSWCWAFRPTWQSIVKQLPANIRVERILGGLAPDSDKPMPLEMQNNLQQVWKNISTAVPGTEFNFNFWKNNTPRRSTWPACRAVVAATQQNQNAEEAMIHAIQKAYYLAAQNPSDKSTLVNLAKEINLDEQLFAETLNSTATKEALSKQMMFSQKIGAMGFPSLILERDGQYDLLQYDYNDPSVVLNNKLIVSNREQR